MVGLGQDVTEFAQTTQVDVSFSHELEDQRKAPRQAGSGHAPERLTFAESEPPPAVVE